MSRPRKPTSLKLVTGTDRADRRNGGEPEPQLLEDLTPPAHLAARSAAVWTELAPMLRRIQLLTEADTIALEMLCDAVADYRLARTTRGDDMVTYSHKGSQMLDQWLVAQQACGKRAETLIEVPGAAGRRFRVLAFCQPRFPAGFRGPELREAAMLILPDHARVGEALAVGSTCRVCQRLQCPARREPSILTA